MEVANLLHAQSDDNRATSFNMQHLEFSLIQLAEEVCTDCDINTTDFSDSGVDVVGPAVYLLKLLVRQFGFPCLKKSSKKHQWLGLQTANQVTLKVYVFDFNLIALHYHSSSSYKMNHYLGNVKF